MVGAAERAMAARPGPAIAGLDHPVGPAASLGSCEHSAHPDCVQDVGDILDRGTLGTSLILLYPGLDLIQLSSVR